MHTYMVTMYEGAISPKPQPEPKVERWSGESARSVLDRIVGEHRPGEDGSVWVLSCAPIVDGQDDGYVSFGSNSPHFTARSFFVTRAEAQTDV